MDWQWPSWVEGLFVTSGPSKQEMNQTKFTHLFDGFGRLSSVNFRNGKAIYSSKLMDTGYYTRSLEQETVAETVLFQEPEPFRWTSWIPGINFYNLITQDNNWVAVELLADNKTFLGTSDTLIKLEIDLETLDAKGPVEF